MTAVPVGPGGAAVALVVLVASAWVVNHVTIAAVFAPVRYVGLFPPLGWQGWLPARSEGITRDLVDTILARIVAVRELYEIMDPARIGDHLVHSLHPRVGALLDRVMLDQMPEVWDQVPEGSRRALVARVQELLRAVVDGFLDDLGDEIEVLFDPHHLTHTTLAHDPSALSRLFARAGRAEFDLLRNAGWRLGVFVAPVVVLAWWAAGVWWVLPLLAALAGLAINQLARHLAFRPFRPTVLGKWEVQGSLPRRQQEAAAVATREIVGRFASIRSMAHSIFEGAGGQQAHALARAHAEPLIRAAFDEVRDDVLRLVPPAVVETTIARLTEDVVDIAVAQLDDATFNVDRQIATERVLTPRVQSLHPQEFEDLFRPAIRPVEAAFVGAGGLAWGLAGLAVALAWA